MASFQHIDYLCFSSLLNVPDFSVQIAILPELVGNTVTLVLWVFLALPHAGPNWRPTNGTTLLPSGLSMVHTTLPVSISCVNVFLLHFLEIETNP